MNSSAMIYAGDAKKRTWTGAIFSVVSSKLLKHFVIFSSKVETRSSRDPLKFSLKLSIIVEAEEEVAFAGRLSTPEDEEVRRSPVRNGKTRAAASAAAAAVSRSLP